MADNWVGIVHTTRPKYQRGWTDMTTRNRLRLAMMRMRSRFETNQSGTHCQWQIQHDRPRSIPYADGVPVDFGQHDNYRTLSIDWRGIVNPDSMTMFQQAQNKGEEALINMFQNKLNDCNKALQEDIGVDMYLDGEATGRENNIHGLETFLGEDPTIVAADLIAKPSDTYGLGALSTVPGADSGTWSSSLAVPPSAVLANDWPFGSGSRSYDYNSPKLVNWSSSSWGTGSTEWEDNCWRVISQAIIWLTTLGGKDGMPTICSLSSDLWSGYKNHHEVVRRINVPHKEAWDLGFRDTLNQDGVAIHCDFDCPVQTGYIENLNHVTVSSIMPQFIWSKGPEQEPRSFWTWLMAAGFFGNLKYRPKHVAKLYPYA